MERRSIRVMLESRSVHFASAMSIRQCQRMGNDSVATARTGRNMAENTPKSEGGEGRRRKYGTKLRCIIGVVSQNIDRQLWETRFQKPSLLFQTDLWDRVTPCCYFLGSCSCIQRKNGHWGLPQQPLRTSRSVTLESTTACELSCLIDKKHHHFISPRLRPPLSASAHSAPSPPG